MFSTRLKNNLDKIIDFRAADDMIQLSKAVFGKIEKGFLTRDAFHVGAKARDAEDRIVYNKKTGVLSYDADGSGTEFSAVKFAQLKAKAALSAGDFLIL